MIYFLIYVLTGSLAYLIVKKHNETKVSFLKKFLFPFLGIIFLPIVLCSMFLEALSITHFQEKYYNSLKTEEEREDFLKCLQESEGDDEDNEDD